MGGHQGDPGSPPLPLGRYVFPPVAPKGAETQSWLGSLVLTALGGQAMAAEEKCGQDRHYWLLAEAGDWRGWSRTSLVIS